MYLFLIDLETEYVRSLLFKTYDKFNPLFPLIEPFTVSVVIH